MIKILFLLLAFVGDIFLGSIFGVGFVQTGISVNTNLLFITLILVTYKEPHFESFITALLLGLVMDGFNPDVFFLNTAVYIFCVFTVRAWATRINYSFIELFFTVLAAVFVKEILLFLYYTMVVGVNISIDTFLQNHVLYTLLLNIVLIVVMVFFKKIRIDEEIYEQQIKQRRASMSNKY